MIAVVSEHIIDHIGDLSVVFIQNFNESLFDFLFLELVIDIVIKRDQHLVESLPNLIGETKVRELELPELPQIPLVDTAGERNLPGGHFDMYL